MRRRSSRAHRSKCQTHRRTLRWVRAVLAQRDPAWGVPRSSNSHTVISCLTWQCHEQSQAVEAKLLLQGAELFRFFVQSSLTGTKSGEIELDDGDPIAVRYGKAADDRIEAHWRWLRSVLEVPNDAAVLKA